MSGSGAATISSCSFSFSFLDSSWPDAAGVWARSSTGSRAQEPRALDFDAAFVALGASLAQGDQRHDAAAARRSPGRVQPVPHRLPELVRYGWRHRTGRRSRRRSRRSPRRWSMARRSLTLLQLSSSHGGSRSYWCAARSRSYDRWVPQPTPSHRPKLTRSDPWSQHPSSGRCSPPSPSCSGTSSGRGGPLAALLAALLPYSLTCYLTASGRPSSCSRQCSRCSEPLTAESSVSSTATDDRAAQPRGRGGGQGLRRGRARGWRRRARPADERWRNVRGAPTKAAAPGRFSDYGEAAAVSGV